MYRLPPDRMAGYQRAQISCPNCKASIIVRDLGGDVADARLATREVSGPVLLTDVRPQSAIVPVDPTWFVAVGRDRKGPFTPLQLSELLAVSTISGQSLVWQKGMTNWVPMVDVLELRPLLRNSTSDAFLTSGPPPMMARPSASNVPVAASAEASAPYAPAAVVPQAPRAPRPLSQPIAPDPDAPRSISPGGISPQPPQPRPISQQVAPEPVAAKVIAKPAKPLAATESDVHAVETETHSESFFTSHHDLDHVAFALPDAEKHKPTKEEYQGMLQEFSVMFRLDKRSKRQKILIAVVVSALVIGTLAFGIIINYQGKQKAELLTDANKILGMFNLPYQTSVTIDVGNEPEPAAKPGDVAKPAKPAGPKQEVQLSDLAAKMRTVVKAKKAATAAKVPALPTVSEEEKKRLMAMLDGGGSGPRGAVIGEALTSGDIKKMCEAQKPSLRSCGQNAGVADFKIRFTVGAGGKVEGVRASADGKDDASLAACCEAKLRKVHLAGASSESFSCTID
jgi:hypothetical protein